MIHLKLRQAGEAVNAKRVHRLYVEERLQIRRRRRKKVPIADRQPLVTPTAPNDVWSADFVFDRTADGRVLKCLTIVDDATKEAVAIIPARALGGVAVTRVLDRLAATRGLPRVLRTDNGLEFCGKAMLKWAHERRVTLRPELVNMPLVRSGATLPLGRRWPIRATSARASTTSSRGRAAMDRTNAIRR